MLHVVLDYDLLLTSYYQSFQIKNTHLNSREALFKITLHKLSGEYGYIFLQQADLRREHLLIFHRTCLY